jgi:hypothetical protein
MKGLNGIKLANLSRVRDIAEQVFGIEAGSQSIGGGLGCDRAACGDE